MNVIGSRPDGWWRDRDGAKRRLVEALGKSSNEGEPVVVFLDGAPLSLPVVDRVEVRFAPGGPNAADRAIVDYVRAAAEPESLRVVTSDAALAADVRGLGAEVIPAGAFRKHLD
jgi:uncharacterized protein YaiI (UPF0178 family)